MRIEASLSEGVVFKPPISAKQSIRLLDAEAIAPIGPRTPCDTMRRRMIVRCRGTVGAAAC